MVIVFREEVCNIRLLQHVITPIYHILIQSCILHCIVRHSTLPQTHPRQSVCSIFLGAFVYVWPTHVCTGTGAPAATFCLSSPDQRSAAQLSHFVRHRICSVLQQWCAVQAPLTTLDPPAREPGREWQGWVEEWQPTQGSWSQRAMKRVTGMTKTQPGWWRITRGKDNFCSYHMGLSHAPMLRLSVFHSSTPDSASLCPDTLSFLFHTFFLSPLLAPLLHWLQATLSVPPSHSVMEGWFVEWRRDEAMEAFSPRKNSLPVHWQLLLSLKIYLNNF